MPVYTYRCRSCGYETDVTEEMHSCIPVICITCGGIMHRRPQKHNVNWGGMRPSQGEISPIIKQFINDAPRRREEEHDT